MISYALYQGHKLAQRLFAAWEATLYECHMELEVFQEGVLRVKYREGTADNKQLIVLQWIEWVNIIQNRFAIDTNLW